ncbi:type II toxin-antitoxin system HicB family antitoxin [Escherichia coli]|uniref:type II toxin-antitoxin system HicB family antitoxin n=1 Tax=Escherichia coli TaxID=562 RepID=UPI0005CF7D4D|nr:type II toxin-antitoxin system HicB family antitoxin [Escherichia coli]HBC2957419.1 type II toxin-antitoxin system HicB family antitoxin [Escherichia coli O146]HDQ6611298.1 type II toxin-antitoxin system HicB family antitoxin [Escherichia coli Ou:H21]HDQ6953127.1 type II toxin-antitoxin system HicB family antitoxin [Escherichia coli Ou:H8]EEC8802968.1 type II toxin-antitoxin system HicB family antitoxin [Escherichia coli]EED0554210.1 type II toxin-antitoxin system HicB family antitoxin [Esc
MSNVLSYKGYFGSIEISLEDNILHGKIQCVNDVVTYEAETLDGLRAAFEEAVTDYLDTCKQLGKSPDKPMSGTFNIRIGRDLHKKAFLAAMMDKTTLNDYVRKAIEEKIAGKKEVHSHPENKETADTLVWDGVFLLNYVVPSSVRTKRKEVSERWIRH